MGARFARGVGNATEGLHLALAALNIGVNDEVIVPPYTWISSASCVVMQNGVPVFADCDAATLALSAETIEAKITNRTKAVILVHMFGYPADLDPIVALCRRRGLRLIEDASHAHGASYKGRMIGTFGDVGVFSLHQRKALCVGDGGILVTDDADIASALFRLRSFGHTELSYNYRMTELAAAIGRVRLRRLDADNDVRIRNAERLGTLLDAIPGVRVRKPLPNTKGVYYRVLVECDPDRVGTAADFAARLRDAGVPAERTWQPLHRHPLFNPTVEPARGCPWKWSLYEGRDRMPAHYADLSFPVIEDYCDRRVLELPVHPPIDASHMRQAAAAFAAIAKEQAR